LSRLLSWCIHSLSLPFSTLALKGFMTIMPRRFESDEHVTLSDDECDASADLPDIFSNDPSEDTSESDAEPDSDDSDGDSEDDSDDDSDDDTLFNDEEQHPPEYYLAEADRLDVSQL